MDSREIFAGSGDRAGICDGAGSVWQVDLLRRAASRDLRVRHDRTSPRLAWRNTRHGRSLRLRGARQVAPPDSDTAGGSAGLLQENHRDRIRLAATVVLDLQRAQVAQNEAE